MKTIAPTPPHLVWIIAGILASFTIANADSNPGGIEQAVALSDTGAYADALPLWREALAHATDLQDATGEMKASIGLAETLNDLGDNRAAQDILEKADQIAKKSTDKVLQARIESNLGEIYMLCPNPDDAEGLLHKSVDLAKASGSPELIGSTLNNLANYDTYTKKYPRALDEYQSAIGEAQKASAPALVLEVESNLTAAAVQDQDWETANTWATKILNTNRDLPDSHQKAMTFIGAGRAFLGCFLRQTDTDDKLRLNAYQCYQQAEQIAEKIHDNRALSYALGYQGELYQLEGRSDDALALSCHAAVVAQDAKSSDILFRWQWQIAKILNKQGHRDDAILAYQTAIATLQSIRHDMAMHFGNINYGSSFREAAGSIYYELADLLLQRADGLKTDSDKQAAFVQARDTVEELKSAELEDYFQDDCANVLRARATKIETISAGALIVYIIPLADRTEILLSLPSGRIERVKSVATADQLESTATTFRFNLENRSSYEFLDQAAQLYDWIIRPLQSIIDQSKVDTLVFVPDGALRTIPMSALYDGQHYLIEKYAIATTPGLTLMDAKPLTATKASLIVNSLSEGVQGFDALTYAKGEADKIKGIYGADELSDKNFTKPNVEKEFGGKENYNIVHIASHGHFDSDVRKTFILTYDGKLSLNDMEEMIKPSQLKDQPVELLTLSACQTAAGDDRAALGLAGIALKAGARSAFATLWFVNDQASSIVVTNFYTNLHDSKTITKAQALRKAQVALLTDPHYGHPCYWAPYLIIGNWL